MSQSSQHCSGTKQAALGFFPRLGDRLTLCDTIRDLQSALVTIAASQPGLVYKLTHYSINVNQGPKVNKQINSWQFLNVHVFRRMSAKWEKNGRQIGLHHFCLLFLAGLKPVLGISMGTSDKSYLKAIPLAKRYTGPVYEQRGNWIGTSWPSCVLHFKSKWMRRQCWTQSFCQDWVCNTFNRAVPYHSEGTSGLFLCYCCIAYSFSAHNLTYCFPLQLDWTELPKPPNSVPWHCSA